VDLITAVSSLRPRTEEKILIAIKRNMQFAAATKSMKDHFAADVICTLRPLREQAIHAAVKSAWPATAIEGCRFHLGQAWFRIIQELGLTKVYRSKSADGSFLRFFF